MSILRNLSACLLVTLLLCLPTLAQADQTSKRFAKDGLAFDYLPGWEVVDSSGPELQQLTLTRRGSSVQIMVVVKREFTRVNELPSAMDRFRETVVKNAATALGSSEAKLKSTSISTRVGEGNVEGVRVNAPTKTGAQFADVVCLKMKLRLVGLAFVRSQKDESAGSKLWEAVRSSLALEPPVVGVMTGDPAERIGPRDGVLNGRALVLAQPIYPAIARAARVSGTVTVQVLIDETGRVVDAHAISGPPLLFAVSVLAARESKFTPSRIDDEPVRVKGVIAYNFVAR